MITYSEDQLIDSIYGDICNSQGPPPPEYFLHHAILAPWNIDVQQMNQKILDRLPGDELVYHSANSVEGEGRQSASHDDTPEDFLHALEPLLLLLSELKMKIGCPLMLLRNLDPNKGLCNGTRMILLNAYRRILEVSIIGGDHHGEKAFIPRITLKPSSRQYAFTLKRRQFPVRLSFAMTINKAQGQSLKYVGLHLQSSVFCHGQLYVRLSRATSSCNVHVLLPETPAGLNRKTANVVYPEVLIDWNYCNTNICGANADRYTHNVLCSIDIILISYETLHSNHYIIDSENLTGRKRLPGLSMTRESQYKSESNNIGAIHFSRNGKWFLPSSHNFGKTFE